MFDLGANLALGFVGLDAADCGFDFGPEVSGGIEQAGNFVFGFDGTPAVGLPLGGEREVQTEIGVGMSFRVVRNFSEPGAGNHDAGGRGSAFVEGVEAGGVLGVSDGEIVGVDDEEFRVGRVAEALGDGFGLGD